MDPVAIPISPIGVEQDRPQAVFLRGLMQYLEGFWPKLANRVNATLPKDGTEAMTGPLELDTYTVATLPAVADYTGSLIYVSDGLSFSGALVTKTSTQAIVTATSTALVWHTEEYDEGGWFASSGDSIFTVPTGVTRVKLNCSTSWAAGGGTYRRNSFVVNGSTVAGASSDMNASVIVGQHSSGSGHIEVSATDTLAVKADHDNGSNLNVNNNNSTYFGVEAVTWYSKVMYSDGTNWLNLG